MDRTSEAASVRDADKQLTQFAESYASFNRVINSLQRQYLELKKEHALQNSRLADVNRQLTAANANNLAANEFLNGILNSLAVGIIAVDSRGIITHFNPAASLMLGIPYPGPIGLAYSSIIPNGNPAEATALHTVKNGQRIDAIEKTITLVDGTILHLSTSTTLLHEATGMKAGAVEVFHDLTKIKKMEQEMARLNTMAALGEMAATIAHQVRNPLAGIGGFASLLSRDIGPDDPKQRTVQKIIGGVDSLNHTITTLLDYTRSSTMNRESRDIEQFLTDTINHFKHEQSDSNRMTEFSLEIFSRPDDAKLILSIDGLLLRQAFLNIFTNAVESSDEDVKITITSRKLPRQKALSLYAERLLLGLDETVVETKVIDSGPGIADEVLPQLFTPFFTTRDGKDGGPVGTGLGLAVASKIIKAHGGDIFASNTDESGACFTIVVPAKIVFVEDIHLDKAKLRSGVYYGD